MGCGWRGRKLEPCFINTATIVTKRAAGFSPRGCSLVAEPAVQIVAKLVKPGTIEPCIANRTGGLDASLENQYSERCRCFFGNTRINSIAFGEFHDYMGAGKHFSEPRTLVRAELRAG